MMGRGEQLLKAVENEQQVHEVEYDLEYRHHGGVSQNLIQPTDLQSENLMLPCMSHYAS